MVGSLALLFVLRLWIDALAFWAQRRLLWRVRRKLILSYVFVGVVPVLLVITFFLLAGSAAVLQRQLVSVKSRIRSLTDQAQFLAQATAAELQPSTTAAACPRDARAPSVAAIETRYPFVSLSIVPVGGLTARWNRPVRLACRGPAGDAAGRPGRGSISTPPVALPSGSLRRLLGPAGLQRPAEPPTTFRTRAWSSEPSPSRTAEPRMGGRPRSSALAGRRGADADETGIRIGEVTALPFGSRENCCPSPAVRSSRLPRTRWTRADAVAHDTALGRVPRLHRLGHRHAVGRHAGDADQRLGDLRPALGGIGERRRAQLRPVPARRARPGRRAVPHHPVGGARHRPAARPPDHRCRPRSVHRHRSTCATATSRTGSRSAPAISSASWPSRSTP